MNVVTGLGLGLLVMVLGAGGLTWFGVWLANREHPKPGPETRET